MRGTRKIAGMLAAGALAAGLSMGMAGAALAADPPAPGSWAELWVPQVNPTAHKCLDVPSGSSTAGVGMQVFHCHGYASNGGPQRWEFYWDSNNAAYEIWNVSSGWCLDYGGFGAQANQGACGLPWEEWRMVANPDGTTFMLQNAYYTDQCLGTADDSGNDHTPVNTGFCSYSGLYHDDQTWALG